MSEPEKDEREAAIQTLEYARGYAQAWREWNACATVPHSFDRNFLERNRVRVGERSSEAVKVLRKLQQEIPANAENARLREGLVYIGNVCIQHDRGDEMGRVLGHIADHARAALEPKEQRERKEKAPAELAEMDADLLGLDPEMKP